MTIASNSLSLHRSSSSTIALGLICFALISPTSVAQTESTEDGKKLVSFCQAESDTDCYTVRIKNASSATVVSTVIDQNSTGGACDKQSVRVKQNNTGNNAVPNKEIQEYIVATLNPSCAYEVKYNVTDGCTGDTRARIKAEKEPSIVGLDKNCGTLKTYKNYE